ncbi:MAG: calcium-binding protein [Planctomycetota bacterium]
MARPTIPVNGLPRATQCDLRRRIVLSVLAARPLHDRRAQVTTRVSIASNGTQSDRDTSRARLSADGRYIAFSSAATNLVAGDTNGVEDIFVRDRLTGTTTRVSVDSLGNQANGESIMCNISGNGRYVCFQSLASNLVPGDTNATVDVFVHDLVTGSTILGSVSSDGEQANLHSELPGLSPDGRLLAFSSFASNLVPGDGNSTIDVFIRDLVAGETLRVSFTWDGKESNGISTSPVMSADGRYVAFESDATNLVPGDTNGRRDIFVRDCRLDDTIRVSVDSSGGQGYEHCYNPEISGDGHLVTFTSRSRLVPEDSNGGLDVYMHDLVTAQTVRISVSSDGEEGNGESAGATLSRDGRFVAFSSSAGNLIGGDTNGAEDAFVRDLRTGETKRVSIATSGAQGDGFSYAADTSADGSAIAFISDARNLVEGDTNNEGDAFVHDRVALRTNGIPSAGQPFWFTFFNANAGQIGNLAVVFLSCSGTGGFLLPNGETLHVDWDACTRVGLQLIPLLSATVDADGNANTPPFVFGDVVPGITIYCAALTYDQVSNAIESVTPPIWFETL